MSSAAIVTMMVICLGVWGGFLVLAVRAIRCESRKGQRADR